jgi:hypothetical protein
MSSKSLRLERLLALYNSFMWDIVRAYKEADWTERELITFLVEHNINLSSRTVMTYVYLYDKLRGLGYTDNVIDRRTPRQWMAFIKGLNFKEKK